MDIVLLGHGSRRGKDTDIGLLEVVRRLRGRLDGISRLAMAGFEFTTPTLDEAVIGLAREGARSIVVMPYFLFDGKHVTIEIPQEMERLRPLIPDVPLIYAHTLGIDSRLVQIVVERAEKALRQAQGIALGPKRDTRPAGIILVRRGSQPEYDPGDNLYQLATVVASFYHGQVRVEPAQAQFGHPTIEEAVVSLDRWRTQVVAVVPYLFFPGKVLYDNIEPSVEQARITYPNMQFHLAETLGVDDRLIDIVLDRLREAGVPC